MKYEYEQICKKSKLTEEETKNVRRVFNNDRRRLRRENEIIEQQEIVIVSIEGDMEGFNEIRNVPDENVNVEEEAVNKVELERLLECLSCLSDQEREIILALYNPAISFEQYARDCGIPQTTLRRKAEKTFIKLQRMMGVDQKRL